ncbi:MAG TPA: LysR family transcriptional regulator [Polyangiaceae bacterium]|nr:LysR family transcriptional regulator [Polyangiaceae bacterium]
MVNAEWVRAFVTFAETLNFTHAAARLHISQPALHVQIRKLGESLQAPLYVRHGRSLALTAEGRKVLAFGREQEERTAQLIDEVKGGTPRDTGVVLAAGEGTFLHLLSEPLRAFQRGKRSKLRVLTRDREQALSAVQLGEAHLAVTVIDDIPLNVISRRVAKVGAAVVMPRNHPLARKRSIAIRDLRDEPLIAPPAGRPLRAALAQAWAAVDQPWAPAVEANGWELMMRFAELGLGVAIVNDFCSPPRGTVRRPLSGLPSLQYQLLRLRDRPQSSAALALEAAIIACSHPSKSQ